MPEDQSLPAAQDSEQQPGADAAPAPSASEESSPAASQPQQPARDRAAIDGREIARLKREKDQLASELARQGQQISALLTDAQRRQQAEEQAYLNSLSPDERNEERIKRLEQRIAGNQRQPTPAPQREEDRTAEIAQRILQKVNTEQGTDLTVDEINRLTHMGVIDWQSPQTFEASLRAVAIQGVQNGSITPTKGVGSEDTVPKDNKQEPTVEQLVEQRVSQEMEKFYRQAGVSRPNSAQAASAPPGAVSTEDYQAINKGYDSRKGPKATREALAQKQRQALQHAQQAG